MNQPDIPILRERAVVNPYLKAANLVLRRLPWDFNPESWRSRHRLQQLRDTRAGQKAVVLCNGPSLLKTDFDRLAQSGVFTFGLNKVNLLFDKTAFRPSCVVAVNHLVLEQNEAFFNQTELPLFLDSRAHSFIKRRANVTFLKQTYHKVFARDVSWSIFYGHTVTFVAIQLAYHLGFQEVALVGCDHNFPSAKGHANQTVVSEASDPNHFDPNYFAGGVKWQLPDLFQSEVAYQMALEVYEASGRRIVNATEGGKLEVYPRQSLADFLGPAR
jgi:hypothetical protein